MNNDYRQVENNSAKYTLYRIFLNESFNFIKFILRGILKGKRNRRDAESVKLIYEKRRADQLEKYEFTDLEDYFYQSQTSNNETKRWNLFDNKLSFDVLKKIQDKKYTLLEEKVISSNTNYVVELGSGGGRNIIYLAKKFPEKTFIGIELTKSSVQLSKLCADKFNISNVEFFEKDLTKPEKYSDLIQTDSLVFSVHCFEEMPGIFKIPLNLLKEKKVTNIFMLEPAYIFSLRSHLLSICVFMRIIYHDRLWGLISFCKKEFSQNYNIKIYNLGMGGNPVNPTNLIDISIKKDS